MRSWRFFTNFVAKVLEKEKKKWTEEHVERELVKIYSNKTHINKSVKPLYGPNNVVDGLLTQEEGTKF